jgi:lysozyme family protein
VTLSASTQQLLDIIIEKQEGGWILSHDKDGGDGGWTFAGITATALKKYPDFQSANSPIPTKEQIYDIYEKEFVPENFEKLPLALRGSLLSACINCGKETAIKLLQTTCNVYGGREVIIVDGILGTRTLNAVIAFHYDSFIRPQFLKQWMLHYIRICVAIPSKLPFLEGWFNRAEYWR